MKYLIKGVSLLILSFMLVESIQAQIFGHGAETNKPAFENSMFQDLNYREIGPFRGGRSVAVAGHDDQPYIYYVGFTGGEFTKPPMEEILGIMLLTVISKQGQ